MTLTKQVKLELLQMNKLSNISMHYDCIALVRFSMTITKQNHHELLLIGEYDSSEIVQYFKYVLSSMNYNGFQIQFQDLPMFRRRYIVQIINADTLLQQLDLIDNNQEFIQGLPTSLVTMPKALCPQVLRSIFLIRGMASISQRNCSIEFSTPNFLTSHGLIGLLQRVEIEAKICETRNSFRVSLRNSTACSKFLNIIGAVNASQTFKEQANIRHISQDINRITNFDTANLRRAADASTLAIQKIKRAYEILGDDIPEHLKLCANLRIENPEISLDELSAQADFAITKFTIAGRLRRLFKLANERATELQIEGIP